MRTYEQNMMTVILQRHHDVAVFLFFSFAAKKNLIENFLAIGYEKGEGAFYAIDLSQTEIRAD